MDLKFWVHIFFWFKILLIINCEFTDILEEIKPTHYDINLNLSDVAADSFNGGALINFIASESSSYIVLHAVDLNIPVVNLNDENGRNLNINNTDSTELGLFIIELTDPVAPNKSYSLSLLYSGNLINIDREYYFGLFRQSYTNSFGEKR